MKLKVLTKAKTFKILKKSFKCTEDKRTKAQKIKIYRLFRSTKGKGSKSRYTKEKVR